MKFFTWTVGAMFVVIFIILISYVQFGSFQAINFFDSHRNTIKIVTSLPMQGISSGQDIVKGVKLALKESGYAVEGFTIELVVKDDGDEHGIWQESLERNNAESAVADRDVMVYIGTFDSGAAKISIPITNRGNLLQISPSNTNPGLTQPGYAIGEPGIFYPTGLRNYFRVVPTDRLQGPAGAIWAKELGIQTVYIVDDGDVYGSGIAGLFEERAKELGLTVLAHNTISNDEKSIIGEVQTIRESGAQMVYYGGSVSNGIIQLINELPSSDELSIKIMGPDGIMDDALLSQTGTHSEGMYITTIGIPANRLTGSGKIFFDNFVSEHGEEPGEYAVFAYEATKVSLSAIHTVGEKNRRKIIEALSDMNDYEGVFGTWNFDGNGDTSLSLISGMTVIDGKFVFMKMLQK